MRGSRIMINETTVSWLEIPLYYLKHFVCAKPSEVPEQKVSALRGGLVRCC